MGGIYPAVDPLDSTSRMLDVSIVGQRHYDVARSTQKILQDYKSLQDIIAILGMDELSEDDKLTLLAPGRCSDSCRSPSSSLRSSLVRQESSWTWQPLFLISMRCCLETVTTFPKPLSTWWEAWRT